MLGPTKGVACWDTQNDLDAAKINKFKTKLVYPLKKQADDITSPLNAVFQYHTLFPWMNFSLLSNRVPT